MLLTSFSHSFNLNFRSKLSKDSLLWMCRPRKLRGMRKIEFRFIWRIPGVTFPAVCSRGYTGSVLGVEASEPWKWSLFADAPPHLCIPRRAQVSSDGAARQRFTCHDIGAETRPSHFTCVAPKTAIQVFIKRALRKKCADFERCVSLSLSLPVSFLSTPNGCFFIVLPTLSTDAIIQGYAFQLMF